MTDPEMARPLYIIDAIARQREIRTSLLWPSLDRHCAGRDQESSQMAGQNGNRSLAIPDAANGLRRWPRWSLLAYRGMVFSPLFRPGCRGFNPLARDLAGDDVEPVPDVCDSDR